MIRAVIMMRDGMTQALFGPTGRVGQEIDDVDRAMPIEPVDMRAGGQR